MIAKETGLGIGMGGSTNGSTSGDEVGADLIVTSLSMAVQDPIGVNIPYKILYDTIQQDSAGGEVSILTNGDVMINVGGYYTVSLTLTMGRDNNNGVAQLITWGTLDFGIGDLSAVPAVEYEFDNSNQRISNAFSNNGFFPANSIVRGWIARNGATNDAGLKPRVLHPDLTTAGAPNVASAVMTITGWKIT